MPARTRSQRIAQSGSNWKCKQCQFSNKAKHTQCDICGAHKILYSPVPVEILSRRRKAENRAVVATRGPEPAPQGNDAKEIQPQRDDNSLGCPVDGCDFRSVANGEVITPKVSRSLMAVHLTKMRLTHGAGDDAMSHKQLSATTLLDIGMLSCQFCKKLYPMCDSELGEKSTVHKNHELKCKEMTPSGRRKKLQRKHQNSRETHNMNIRHIADRVIRTSMGNVVENDEINEDTSGDESEGDVSFQAGPLSEEVKDNVVQNALEEEAEVLIEVKEEVALLSLAPAVFLKKWRTGEELTQRDVPPLEELVKHRNCTKMWDEIPKTCIPAFQSLTKMILQRLKREVAAGEEHKANMTIVCFLLVPIVFLRSTRGGNREHRKLRAKLMIFHSQGNVLDNAVALRSSGAPLHSDRLEQNARRCQKYAYKGYIGKAMRTLTSNGIEQVDRQGLELKAAELFPKGDGKAMPRPEAVGGAGLVEVDEKTLDSVVKHCNNGAAPGASGWTAEHLEVILRDEEGPALIKCMMEMIVNGQVHGGARDLLCGGVLVLANKTAKVQTPVHNHNNGNRESKEERPGGTRPICMPEILYKVAAKLAMRSLSESDVTEYLTDLQQGVMRSGGCENTLHLLAALMSTMGENEDGKGVVGVSFDIKNAFNSINRRQTLQRVFECEELQPVFKIIQLRYCTPSRVAAVDNRGEAFVITVLEGVAQGDPLAMLIFCVAMKPVYETALNGLNPKLVQGVAVADDFVGVGSWSGVKPLIDQMQRVCNEEGLQMPTEKFFLFGDVSAEVEAEAKTMGIRTERGVAVILGAPFAQDEQLITDWLRKKISKIREKTILLQHDLIKKQARFHLLRSSVNQSLQYLMRVIPPNIMQPICKEFDEVVEASLADLLELVREERVSNEVKQRCRLKISQGGLGFTAAERVGKYAYIASMAKARDLVMRRVMIALDCSREAAGDKLRESKIGMNLQTACVNFGSHLRAIDNDEIRSNVAYKAAIALIPEDGNSFSFWIEDPRINSDRENKQGERIPLGVVPLSKAWGQADAVHLHTETIAPSNNLTTQSLVQLRIRNVGHTSAWMAATGKNANTRMTDPEMTGSLRRALNLTDLSISGKRKCRCGKVFSTTDCAHHVLVCSMTGPIMQHNAIQKACTSELSARGYVIEMPVPRFKGTQADFFMHSNNGDSGVLVDVTVVCNSAPTYVKILRTANDPRATLLQREKNKREKHKRHASVGGPFEGAKVMAATVDMNGMFGSELLTFMQKVQGGHYNGEDNLKNGGANSLIMVMSVAVQKATFNRFRRGYSNSSSC